MTTNTEEKLGSLAEKAISSLTQFFGQEDHTGKDIGAARIATAVLSSWTRHAQTKSAEKATMFMVARELASDKEQLTKYVRLTMPDLGLIKALPETK